MTREQSIDELSKSLAEHRAAALVGAGVSLAAGLPTWKQLLLELIVKLKRVPGIESHIIESCERMVQDRSKWLLLASILRRQLGPNFDEYIQERFCQAELEPTPAHKAIVDLPFQFFLTLNYDDLLESAYSEKFLGKRRIDPITYDKPGDVASYFYRGSLFVLYCHGRAKTNSDRLILSDADYRTLIQAQIGYQSILQTLFTTTSFLFVGNSLYDPDIQLLLGFLHDAFHRKTPNHYVLIPETERESAEINQLFHDFKINVIELPSDDYSDNVLKYLSDLSSA